MSQSCHRFAFLLSMAIQSLFFIWSGAVNAELAPASWSDQKVVDAARQKAMNMQSESRWQAMAGRLNFLRYAHGMSPDKSMRRPLYEMAKGINLKANNALLLKKQIHHRTYSRLVLLFGKNSQHFPGRLSPEVEARCKKICFDLMNKQLKGTDAEAEGQKKFFFHTAAWYREQARQPADKDIMYVDDHTTRPESEDYLRLLAIQDDPKYANRKLGDGATVREHYLAATAWWAEGLKRQALFGLFDVYASNNYEAPHWVGLVQLSYYVTDPLFKKRLRMFMDIAFVEIAQKTLRYHDSPNGLLQCGHKSRAKKGGLYREIDRITLPFYGDDDKLELPGMKAWRPPVPAVLLRNRLKRPAETYQLFVRIIKGLYSKRYNSVYMTPEYGIGCSLFDPNGLDGGKTRNIMNAWTGAIFRGDLNYKKRMAVSFPHGHDTGDKWNLHHKEVIINQFWHNCYYRGFTNGRVDFTEGFQITEKDGWVFGWDQSDGYVAVKVCWGKYKWVKMKELPPHSKNRRWEERGILFSDRYAPVIMQVGRKADYGSFQGFQAKILAAPLSISRDRIMYHGPNNVKLEFFPTQSAKLAMNNMNNMNNLNNLNNLNHSKNFENSESGQPVWRVLSKGKKKQTPKKKSGGGKKADPKKGENKGDKKGGNKKSAPKKPDPKDARKSDAKKSAPNKIAPGKKTIIKPENSNGKKVKLIQYQMPKINGQRLNLTRNYSYKSPYLNSIAGSNLVTLSYGSRHWEYDFRKNTITEVKGNARFVMEDARAPNTAMPDAGPASAKSVAPVVPPVKANHNFISAKIQLLKLKKEILSQTDDQDYLQVRATYLELKQGDRALGIQGEYTREMEREMNRLGETILQKDPRFLEAAQLVQSLTPREK